ncbi:MAG: protein translocase subunit SecF [Candidatus Aminicenantes bacterium]|nr:MAG: protein translocase subunit SecF [Candidatus Aminicenantes bacterium]
MQIFKKPNFKFMKYKYIAFSISGVLILIGIINITSGKGLNPGIDFAGGSLIRVMLKDPVSTSYVRESLGEVGLSRSQIQQLEKSERDYIIRSLGITGEEGEELGVEAHEIIGNKVIEALSGAEDKSALESGLRDLNRIDTRELTLILEPSFPEQASVIATKIVSFRTEEGIIQDFDELQQTIAISQEAVGFLKGQTFLGQLTVLSRETVGPQVGHDLRRKATQATVWALLGLLIYIGIRFKLAYGVSAILTLAHDVLITLGIFSLTNREINLPVIAAILTIVGYSLNDTIVIFDRVRDNLRILRRHDFGDILDASINQTLSRTVITSSTTFLTVFALFLFGGKVINDFAFTLIIGVLVGTYSSIYQSCPLLYFWNIIFKPKKGMRK